MMMVMISKVDALSDGEIVALKDMQAEWGSQLGWTGSPSCSWSGVICDSLGNVIKLYVLFHVLRKNLESQKLMF